MLKLDLSSNKKLNLLRGKKLNPFKKKKINLKGKHLLLSKREFILLGLLIFILEGYVLAHYLIIPKWQQLSSERTHYRAQQTLLMNLNKDMANKNQFDEQLKLLDYKLNTLRAELPSNLTQEDIILNVNKYAGERQLMIKGITFTNVSMLSKQDFAAGKTPSAQSQNNGNNSAAAPTPPANNSNTAPQNASGMVLVDDINIYFSGSYEALYNFISDLEKNERRILVRGITITKGDNNALTGELAVEYLGYKGQDDNSNYQMETPAINGKFDIFAAFGGINNAAAPAPTASAAPVKASNPNPNFYLILNTYDDNAPKVIMGDYTKDGTELYSNTNDKVSGKLTVSGSLGHFSYVYALGTTTQSKEGNLILDGGKLRFDVISQHRKSAGDKVSLDMMVENNTDYPLVVNIINDDKDTPRFNLVNKSGNVTVNG
ncbi:hypothetical protein ACHOLT_03100 [Desulfitobacterium sp. Sab5]|uniref:hypothetical protein n=1 Tax=Desulfitobacterium nosdiversum TaxID=3375356 RepID=UPI003CF5B9B3